MSKNSAREAAAQAFAEAILESGARDPREFYRERLRELKTADPTAYAEAVDYYQNTLIPTVAGGETNALQAWLDYGFRLAAWVTPGEAVTVDPSGLRRERQDPIAPDHLLLHIPNAKTGRALVVGIPAELSPAQRATYELLVRGRLKLRPQPEGVT